MDKGSMRLEPNISLTQNISKLPNYKVELKNINSFKYVKKAIDFEVQRQTELLNQNKKLGFETRGYDENKNITFPQRVKEVAMDYRYFPEPDIPVMSFNQNYFKKIIIPELPDKKIKRLTKKYNIKQSDAFLLVKSLNNANLFEKISKDIKFSDYQKIANFIINNPIKNKRLTDYVKEIKMFLFPKKQDVKIIKKVIEQIIIKNTNAVQDYKNGKETVLMFLIGQIVREFKSKLNIQEVKKILISYLNKIK